MKNFLHKDSAINHKKNAEKNAITYQESDFTTISPNNPEVEKADKIRRDVEIGTPRMRVRKTRTSGRKTTYHSIEMSAYPFAQSLP